MMPSLLLVSEVLEYTILSSSNEEDAQTIGTQSVKHEHVFLRSMVKLEPLDTSSDGDRFESNDVLINSSSGLSPATCCSSDDLVVSETPSRTLNNESIGLLDSTIKIAVSQAKFTLHGHNVGTQVSSIDVTSNSGSSIYELVVAIGNQPNTRCILKTVDLALFLHHTVKYLPQQYNMDAIFELPAILAPKDRATSQLDGMDRKFDGHAWT